MRGRRGRGEGDPVRAPPPSLLTSRPRRWLVTSRPQPPFAPAKACELILQGAAILRSALRGCLDTGIPSLLQTVGARRYVSARDGLLTFEAGFFQTTSGPYGIPSVRPDEQTSELQS